MNRPLVYIKLSVYFHNLKGATRNRVAPDFYNLITEDLL